MNSIIRFVGVLCIVYGGFGIVNSLLGSHFTTTIFDVFIVIGGYYLIKRTKNKGNHLTAKDINEGTEYRKKAFERLNKERDYQGKTSDMMKTLGLKPLKILWGLNYSVGIDHEIKKFCLVSISTDREPINPKLINFTDIIKVEFVENNIISGGGGYIDIRGGSISAVTNRSTYSVKAIVKDLQNPIYDLRFQSKSDAEYCYGILTSISGNHCS